MHRNAELLNHLFTSLNRHDYAKMTECYGLKAQFHDIAFHLYGRDQIGLMWRMICEGDIRADFRIVDANERGGTVELIDEYTFPDTGRPVRNRIQSRFRFRDGRVEEQRDSCDPKAWAAMAIGGPGGFIAGRIPLVRRWKARSKLSQYVRGLNK